MRQCVKHSLCVGANCCRRDKQRRQLLRPHGTRHTSQHTPTPKTLTCPAVQQLQGCCSQLRLAHCTMPTQQQALWGAAAAAVLPLHTRRNFQQAAGTTQQHCLTLLSHRSSSSTTSSSSRIAARWGLHYPPRGQQLQHSWTAFTSLAPCSKTATAACRCCCSTCHPRPLHKTRLPRRPCLLPMHSICWPQQQPALHCVHHCCHCRQQCWQQGCRQGCCRAECRQVVAAPLAGWGTQLSKGSRPVSSSHLRTPHPQNSRQRQQQQTVAECFLSAQGKGGAVAAA